MKLNSNQKNAVNHFIGPLLIIAGAGTGKTRVITSRILELIKFGHAKPSEILALTFTDKAANEMIERVDIEMPLSYEELCIKTFHAFSDQVLRESGLEIGIDSGFKLLSQVEQWFFFKKHLYEFDLDYYRPLGNPNKFIYDILNHFGRLKDECIAPLKYIEYAAKLDGDESVKIQEIARVYKQYQDLLVKNNYLDFGDLSFYANELFDKRESCLKKYQNRYKFILVDEFQDTNYAQFQLVLKLAGESRNVAVVGDDDQSIYKWRGASLSNILQFEKHFPDAKKIVLTENYRSSQNILDAAYSLIKNNNPDRLEEKMGISKHLECNNNFDASVEIHQFPDFVHESRFVAEKIEFLLEREKCDCKDIAILVRANSHTHPFIDELKSLGIPYQVKNPKGLFSLEEIKDLIAVSRIVSNPRDDISFLRILKMDVFDIEMAEILELLNNEKHEHIYDTLKDREQTLPGIAGIRKVYEIVSDLIAFSKKYSVGLVINEFIQKSGLLNYLIENDKFEELENINEFAKQTAKFEKENQNRSVIDFTAYLDLLEEANAVFSSEAFTDRNSVQILTVHGAKGLEYDHVFIVNAVKHRFPSMRRGEIFEIPDELTNEIYPEGDFHIQEERRLFYVAMTRAKKNLFITYSNQYEGNKKWQMSPFLNEVLDSGKAIKTEHEEDKDALTKLRDFKEPAKPIFNLPPFKHKKLSYSQFDMFKICPLKYNYHYLMNVPVPPSHTTNFGSSVHDTLNEIYQRIKAGKDVDLDIIKVLYEKNWIPYGYENEDQEHAKKQKGFELLTEFYKKNCNPWIVPVYLEKPFNIKIGEYWITGKIDRIDKLEDGTFEVIDYKTGQKPDKANFSKDLQLSIYALACKEALGISASKLSFYYLDGNKKISTSRTNADLKNVKHDIEVLIAEMKKSKFQAAPNYFCQFCDYKIICPAV